MTRTLSSAALAAKEIRTILKQKFPNTKFRVKSDNFSMGDSVDVEWTDGPTSEAVDKLIAHYQYGNFNSMEDIYELTNRRDDIPQTKYLHTTRNISADVFKNIVAEINEKFGWTLEVEVNQWGTAHVTRESDFFTGNDWASYYVRREFNQRTF